MSDDARIIPFPDAAPRQPPANILAEQALLGALLANNRAFDRLDGLRAEHFADPINGRIFAAIQARVQAGKLADAITLRQDFEAAGTLRDVGGMAYLAQLLAGMVSTLAAAEYATSIRDAWARRRLIEAGEQLAQRAQGDAGDIEAILVEFTAAVDDIRAAGGEAKRGLTGNEIMDAALAAADRACAGGASGISTGMTSVDRALGGLEPATLNVLAGRPGSGKSSLGQQWAVAAARAGVPVLEFSLEMSGPALGRRILSAASGVPIWRMKRGAHADYAAKLLETRRELADLPITVHDGGRFSAAEIAAKCRAAKRKSGLGLIVVDHLHLVRPEEESRPSTGQPRKSLKRLMQCWG